MEVGNAYEPAALAKIEAARERIAATIVRTPLVRLEIDAPAEIFLELENLQPIGSFKLRGAGNALALVDPAELAGGVWTASAGNMAQAVAWHAGTRGIRCTVVVPETAPKTKLDAIRRLGAEFVKVPVPTWIEVFRTRTYPGMEGVFVHPFSDPNVIAGNGTIGIEIVEDLPEVDAVLVPYGGGGLSCGIASALRALVPSCKVYACEVETAAPLGASLAAGQPVTVEHETSFVDGIGAPTVFPEMFA
ncbi:MAG TPA: pyridoxal-phosphate dependent enzyme, partial [Gaiellaceae bacterium]|nr:pyridoxal-phosphate dependent enzyme [Gaiellaceae bacterium]